MIEVLLKCCSQCKDVVSISFHDDDQGKFSIHILHPTIRPYVRKLTEHASIRKIYVAGNVVKIKTISVDVSLYKPQLKLCAMSMLLVNTCNSRLLSSKLPLICRLISRGLNRDSNTGFNFHRCRMSACRRCCCFLFDVQLLILFPIVIKRKQFLTVLVTYIYTRFDTFNISYLC